MIAGNEYLVSSMEQPDYTIHSSDFNNQDEETS